MSKTTLSVQMNKSATKQLKEAQIKAFRATAAKMLADKVDAQEIPFGEGTLQNVYTDVDDAAAAQGVIQINSVGPYAMRLYYNPQYNFNTEFNAHAKGEWWEDYLTGKNKDRPKQVFDYFYKKYSGGYVE